MAKIKTGCGHKSAACWFFWSRRPGLNRGPADYESLKKQ